MPLDPEILARLACPRTHEPLVYVEAAGLLYARRARLAYPVEAGLPILLPEAARPVGDTEAAHLERLLEAAPTDGERPPAPRGRGGA